MEMQHSWTRCLLALTSLFLILAMLFTSCNAGSGQPTEPSTPTETTKPTDESKPTDKEKDSGNDQTEPHVHAWSDWAVTSEPTCTEAGEESRSCSCGEVEKKAVEAKGHAFGEWETITEPTCTEKGEQTRECACGEVETQAIDAKGHTYTSVVADPTCTEKGYTTHTCECGYVYSDAFINASGHDYASVTSAPTCTERGYTTYTCSCGDSYVDNYVSAKGHSFDGWKTTKEATCTEKGEQKRECICGEIETKSISAKGHSYDAVVTKPTCTERGYTTHTCDCGDSYIDNYVSATGHRFGAWETTKEATCTEKGEQKRVCDCGEVETKTIPATNHTYKTVVTEPTCEERGYTTYTCECGDSYIDEYVNATGHSFGEWKTTKEATCTEKGEQKRECDCGEVETKVIPTIGHSYDAVVTHPTCDEDGYTTHVCSCGDSYISNYVDATGHTFGEWQTTKEATCTENGSQKRECDCGEIEIKIIPATGHSYKHVVTSPTCTEKGYTTHTCACGDFYVDTYTEPRHTNIDNDGSCDNCNYLFPGLYDANDQMIASWDELVNTYGLNATLSYDFQTIEATMETNTASLYYILKNNAELSASVKLVIGDIGSIGECAFYGCDGLTSVVFSSSITRVGGCAFRNCTNLTNVHISDIVAWCKINFPDFNATPLCYAKKLYLNGELVTDLVIPDGVTSIGKMAFAYCDSITSVTLPNTLTSIDDYAFAYCTNLTSIPLPENLTSIGLGAFEYCSTLTSINIPSSVKSIESNVFIHSNLSTIHITDLAAWCNTAFTTTSLATYTADLSLYLNGELVTDLAIPEGVTSICDYAFYHFDCFKSITLPETLTSIGEKAFQNCANVTSITIPKNVKSIGESAFAYCTRLVEVYDLTPYIIISAGERENGHVGWAALDVYTSLDAKSKLSTTDDGFIFYEDGITRYLIGYIGNETEISLPDDRPYSIYEEAFKGYYTLTSIIIPETVKGIGNYAFEYCDNLKSIIIPDSVVTIGRDAFFGCSSLTSVYISDLVTSIEDSTFSCCENLTSIILSENIMNIGDGAFYRCNNLKTVYYRGTPERWETIRFEELNYDNDAIKFATRYYYSETQPIKDNYWHYVDGMPTIWTPIVPGLYDANDNLIASWDELVNEYGMDVEKAYTVETFHTDTSSPYYVLTENEALSNGVKLVVGDVDVIGSYTFCSYKVLVSVVLPDGITSIGERAFQGCYQLTEINIPNTVTTINRGAFYACKRLANITIPDGVTTIGQSAFDSCTGLSSVTISNSVTSIGNYAFYNCSSLASITFEGTKAEWDVITKGTDWNYNVPATEVICSDGVVKLK